MRPLCVVLIVFFYVFLAHAADSKRIKTIGVGDHLEISKEGMKSDQLKRVDLFRIHCTSCHSENRIIVDLNSWGGGNQAQYEEYLKEMMNKKIRISKGELSHQNAKAIYDLLVSISSSPVSVNNIKQMPIASNTNH